MIREPLRRRGWAAFAAVLVWAAPAGAARYGRLSTSPCAGDVNRYCSSQRNEMLTTCLWQRRLTLAPTCNMWLTERRRWARLKLSRQQARTACQQDVARFCRKERPGGDHVRRCLESKPSVSSRCRDFLAAVPHQTGPCDEDVGALCGRADPAGDAVDRCLLRNTAKVSADCRAYMAMRVTAPPRIPSK